MVTYYVVKWGSTVGDGIRFTAMLEYYSTLFFPCTHFSMYSVERVVERHDIPYYVKVSICDSS